MECTAKAVRDGLGVEVVGAQRRGDECMARQRHHGAISIGEIREVRDSSVDRREHTGGSSAEDRLERMFGTPTSRSGRAAHVAAATSTAVTTTTKTSRIASAVRIDLN